MDSPFHAGERHIQHRLGVRDKLEDIGRRVIRDHMPEQHREFFATLPWLLVGSLDAHGQPQASALWGDAGFLHSSQPRQLCIDDQSEEDDPLAANLRHDTCLGLLGIELPTRRRNRMSGRLAALRQGRLVVEVHESFGNSPKYIQQSHWQAEPPPSPFLPVQGS